MYKLTTIWYVELPPQLLQFIEMAPSVSETVTSTVEQVITAAGKLDLKSTQEKPRDV